VLHWFFQETINVVSVGVRVGPIHNLVENNSRQLACIRQVQGSSHPAWNLLSKPVQMYSFPNIHPTLNMNSELFPWRFKELERHLKLASRLRMRGYLPPYSAFLERLNKGARSPSVLHSIRMFHFNNKWTELNESLQYRDLQRAVGPLWSKTYRHKQIHGSPQRGGGERLDRHVTPAWIFLGDKIQIKNKGICATY
jgi:hypothetical protein